METAEKVETAAQTMSLVVSDLVHAIAEVRRVNRLEGTNLHDRATAMYLSDCLKLAKELESKLSLVATGPVRMLSELEPKEARQ